MKNLSHITEKVYGQPWLIRPLVHRSISTQLENVLTGKIQLPSFTDKDDEATIVISGIQSIAVIEVDGIIGKRLSLLETECGGCDLDSIAFQIKEVASDPNIKTIVFNINSPGGTVTGVREIGELIAEVSKTKNTIAYTDTLCASAAYWIASQCNEIVVSASSDIGSIGVYSLYLDETRALEIEGLKVNAISAGKYKLVGSSFKPMQEDERALLQADIDKIYNQFKAAVTNKRNIPDEYMQGQIFDGEKAVQIGIADGVVNSFDDLIEALTTNP